MLDMHASGRVHGAPSTPGPDGMQYWPMAAGRQFERAGQLAAPVHGAEQNEVPVPGLRHTLDAQSRKSVHTAPTAPVPAGTQNELVVPIRQFDPAGHGLVALQMREQNG